jgi:hypothetical protein
MTQAEHPQTVEGRPHLSEVDEEWYAEVIADYEADQLEAAYEEAVAR